MSVTQSSHQPLRHHGQQQQQKQQQQMLLVVAQHPKVTHKSAPEPLDTGHGHITGPGGVNVSPGQATAGTSSGAMLDFCAGAFGATAAFGAGPSSGSDFAFEGAVTASWGGAGATLGGGDRTGGTFGGGTGTAGDSLSFDDLDAALSTAVAARAVSQAASGDQSRRQKRKQRGKPQTMQSAAVQSTTSQSATMQSAPRGLHRGESSHSTGASAFSNNAGTRAGDSAADGTEAGKDFYDGPQHVSAGDYSAGDSSSGDQGLNRAAGNGDAVWVDTGPPLPRFHLRWVPEREAAVAALGDAEARHIAELVQRYQTDHEMVGATGFHHSLVQTCISIMFGMFHL